MLLLKFFRHGSVAVCATSRPVEARYANEGERSTAGGVRYILFPLSTAAALSPPSLPLSKAAPWVTLAAMSESRQHSRPLALRRWLLFALGWVCFGLGVLGAFLPVLPTTPFMLLALWAFSASSPRFHDWLYGHRVFGPPLQRWRTGRVIPLSAKVFALASMAASFGWASLGTRAPWYALAAMAALMAYGAFFILRQPSRTAVPPPDPQR